MEDFFILLSSLLQMGRGIVCLRHTGDVIRSAGSSHLQAPEMETKEGFLSDREKVDSLGFHFQLHCEVRSYMEDTFGN